MKTNHYFPVYIFFNLYILIYIYIYIYFFFFLLFLGMVIYANEFETKEKQKLPEIKN